MNETQPAGYPNVFDFMDYREFLRTYLERACETGTSARHVAQRCQLKSSNYLQLIAAGKRSVTQATGEKIADGIGLVGLAKSFFLQLISIERCRSSEAKVKAYKALHHLVDRARRKRIIDDSIHSAWLHAVVWVLVETGSFPLTVAEAKARLGAIAKDHEFEASIDFLIRKKFLVETESPGIYRQNDVSFVVRQDIRRVDVQMKHAFFLDMAKHRLHDDASKREFQNLTIAVNDEGMELVKTKIRSFMQELHQDLLKLGAPTRVIHVQFAAFHVSRSGLPDPSSTPEVKGTRAS